MRRAHLVIALSAALATVAVAEIKVLKNDSVPDTGGTVACQAGFAANEIGAAVFTVSPSDAPIMLLQAQWFACDGSGFGLAQARPMQVLLYNQGSPNPGAPFFTSGNVNTTPGFLNVLAVDAQNVVYNANQNFTVGVRLINGSLFQNFTTLATDADGCQAGKSMIFAIPPSQWTDACSLGVAGDMFVRMKVLTQGPKTYGTGLAGINGVPAISATGKWSVGSTNFTLKCANAKPSAPGYLFLGLSPVSIPTYGGTLLVGPPGLTVINLAANASGQVTLPAAIPNDLAFVNLHVYLQFAFVDAAAPVGVSFSNGLDLKISETG